MLYLSLSIFAIALIAYLRAPANGRVLSGSFGLIAALYLLFTLFYVIADYLSGNGIDESVVYHLLVDVGGVGLKDFTDQIIFAVGGIFVALLVGGLTFYRSQRLGVRTVRRHYMTLSFLPIALIAHPGTDDIYSLVRLSVSDGGTEQPEHYEKPPVELAFREPKNLIYIYLESLEGTYLDENTFPGLLPNLQRIKSQAYSFDNIRQAQGTGWTIAGMVASQCGTPLVRPVSDPNASTPLGGFFSKATCIGDLLDDAGYNLSYMGGAKLTFAGKGEFYRDHGFHSVRGLEELRDRVDPDYLTDWGIYDDTLFDLMREEIARLDSETTPYAFYGLTLDTHHPYGHVSRSCGDLVYADGQDPMLNALHCSDRLVGEFYDWLSESGKLKNTTLVLASDHFAMRNTLWETLSKMDRRNLFMLIDPDLKAGTSSKIGSTLDILPTLLTTVGHEISSYGYGRSLWSDSLIIDAPEEDFTVSLALVTNKGHGYLKSLWSDLSVKLGDLEQKAEAKKKSKAEAEAELSAVKSIKLSELKGVQISFGVPESIQSKDPLNIIAVPSTPKVQLYGFDGKKVYELRSVDICNEKNSAELISLAEYALSLSTRYKAYLVTGSLSDVCSLDKPDIVLSRLFFNSGLSAWTGMLSGSKYAGAVVMSGPSWESSIEKTKNTTIKFTD